MLSAAPLAAAVLGGTLLTYLWEKEASPAGRACVGVPLGLALLGIVGICLSLVLGLTPTAVWTSSVLVASPALLLARPELRDRCRAELLGARDRLLRPSRADLATALFVLAVAALLWAVFDRALFEQEGGVYTGVEHNIGDLPFHVAVISSFAYGGNLPPEHPELAGTRLTYPILADFLPAMLLRAGMTLRLALLSQNLLLALALAGLLFRFSAALTGDRAAARLALPLLFLSGGLGFALFVGDLPESGAALGAFLLDLPRDYTITWTGELRWGNVLTTLMMPQRSLLLGAPLALAVWMLWWTALAPAGDPISERRRLAAAGALAGLLPLAHAHAFLVTLGMGACLAVLFWRPRSWALFFTLAVGLGLPQVAWMAAGSGVRAGGVVAWSFGWDRGGRNPFWFWFTNTGLLLPLLGIALWRLRRERLARFYAPFLLLLLVPNALKLSPWIWDNIKFLFFWHLASIPLVAGLLLSCWRRGRPGRIASLLLAGSLLTSGSLDVWRVASRQIALEVFDAEAVALAVGPLRGTPRGSLILHTPTYNSPVYLSGRRSLLGYPGHIWSQGLDAGSREEEIRRIYSGGADAAALLAHHGVDYVLVGPQEREWTNVNDEFLSRYTPVATSGAYRLWKIR